MVEKLIATPTEKNFSFDIAYYILLHYILLHCLVEMLMAQILIHLTSCCHTTLRKVDCNIETQDYMGNCTVVGYNSICKMSLLYARVILWNLRSKFLMFWYVIPYFPNKLTCSPDKIIKKQKL